MRAMQLPETHSPASPQLANSARGPPGAKGAGQCCHGAKRALSLKTHPNSSNVAWIPLINYSSSEAKDEKESPL